MYKKSQQRNQRRFTLSLVLIMIGTLISGAAWASVATIDSSILQHSTSVSPLALERDGSDTPAQELQLIRSLERHRLALMRAARRANHPLSFGVRLQAAPSAAAPIAPTTSSVQGTANWSAIAQCESGGRWDLNSGNGYWGGLQFSPGTWFAYGGGAFDGTGAFPYSSAEQIAVAERVLAGQGPSAWPSCFVWG
jgi:hypothetical protein